MLVFKTSMTEGAFGVLVYSGPRARGVSGMFNIERTPREAFS
jgi:hypothetical protein